MADNILKAFAGCLFQSQQTFSHAAHVRQLKKPSAGATMSERRLAPGVKFNLSKENIFVSVRLIYTLRLTVLVLKMWKTCDFHLGSAELEDWEDFIQKKSYWFGLLRNQWSSQWGNKNHTTNFWGFLIDNLFKRCMRGYYLRMFNVGAP